MLQMEKHDLKPAITGGETQTLTSSAVGQTVLFRLPSYSTDIDQRSLRLFFLETPEPQFDSIVQNPQICMGEPIIRGTRITAAFVYRLVKSGMQVKEVLEAYPQLREEDVRQAIEFVEKTYGGLLFAPHTIHASTP